MKKLMTRMAVVVSAAILTACQITGQPPADPAANIGQSDAYQAAWANTFHGQRDNIQTSWRVATADAAIK